MTYGNRPELNAQGALKKKKEKTGVPTYLPFFEIF
jgi:hypothetical protein